MKRTGIVSLALVLLAGALVAPMEVPHERPPD